MHTKGKWTVNSTIIQDDCGYPIAQVWPVTRLSPTESIKQMKANARLIAAAPRLLAACDYAYGLLTQRDSDTDIDKAEVIEILQGIIEAAKEVQNGHERF